MTTDELRPTSYSVFAMTHDQLLARLTADREEAAAFRGDGPQRWRSSTDIDRHNRTIRRLQEAGEITDSEAARLRITY